MCLIIFTCSSGPCLATLLGNLFLRTLLWNLGWEPVPGNLVWEPAPGNLGTLVMEILAAPTCSETFTVAEDPLTLLGEKGKISIDFNLLSSDFPC